MEIEMGPCAEFSLYHLMELDEGEERLKAGRQLIRSSINMYGQGDQLTSDARFRAGVAQLQDVYPIPEVSQAARGNHIPNVMSNPVTLSDACRVLRSKNAGPFEITLDAIFVSKAAYQSVKASGLLSKERVAEVLGVAGKDIVWMGFSDPALAFKVTIPRFRAGKMRSAGGFMESDIHGSQQHTDLASIKLQSVVTGWRFHERIASLIEPLWEGRGSWYRMAALISTLWSVSVWAAARHLVSRQKGG